MVANYYNWLTINMFRPYSAIIRLTTDGVNQGTYYSYTDGIPWFTFVCYVFLKFYKLLVKIIN